MVINTFAEILNKLLISIKDRTTIMPILDLAMSTESVPEKPTLALRYFGAESISVHNKILISGTYNFGLTFSSKLININSIANTMGCEALIVSGLFPTKAVSLGEFRYSNRDSTPLVISGDYSAVYQIEWADKRTDYLSESYYFKTWDMSLVIRNKNA